MCHVLRQAELEIQMSGSYMWLRRIRACGQSMERRQLERKYDVDGDNRLRVHHPIEMSGLAIDPALVDGDGDEYVDEFDLFIARFDSDGDGRVVWDPARAVAAPSSTVRFELGVAFPSAKREICVLFMNTRKMVIFGTICGFFVFAAL